MYSETNKSQGKKGQLTHKAFSQKKDEGKSSLPSIDHKSAPIAQRRLQAVSTTRPGVIQGKEGVLPQQHASNMRSSRSAATIQRLKNVYLETNDDDRKSLVAEGKVKDFQDGTKADDEGWLGVTKYRSWYTIDSKDGKYHDEGAVGPLQNYFTNPEAGHVLGKQNGGNGGDPENVFAQDGGTNNGKYKSFEIGMRNTLNLYKPKDKVKFKSYLEGDDIKIGTISDDAMSEASDIDSD
ncbi:MAG: hypothetical protein A3D92_16165 [Bacteroidetes bacterium RIFCSPHIGHO2_02_FULL_44_7]|nr:MAG: hypothetical protein A3D92_16165 [Bacteroidetes bacterium RIFCSPHIGHO2_02_FULL_44_7]